MAALATTSSLSDYHRLSISSYRDRLRKSGKASSIEVAYFYHGKSYRYAIQLTTTAPHYGGSRYFFNCPSCSKRVSVLYRKGTYICRKCIGLGYQSQLEQPVDRLFTRLNAIRERLQWSKGIANPQGGKPRYMHDRTYERLLTEYDRLTDKLIRIFY
nr:hypothetical protein [Psychrobacter sp.]